MFTNSVKILLLMGASIGTKVRTACIENHIRFTVTESDISEGFKKWTHVPSHGFPRGEHRAVKDFPGPSVFG